MKLILNQSEIKAPSGRGGPRPGSGRPRGSTSKRTKELTARLEASSADPLQFLIEVMLDESWPPALRVDAAKSLLPYRFPRLSPVQVAPPAEALDHSKPIDRVELARQLAFALRSGAEELKDRERQTIR